MGHNSKVQITPTELRVALLYFGQPRFTTNKLAIGSQFKHIFKKYRTDVFAYLWYAKKAIYQRSDWGGSHKRSWTKAPIVNPKAIDHLKGLYSDIKIKTEEPKTFLPLTEIPKDKISARNIETNLSNILSHLYIFEQSGKYLAETGNLADYDFVVISRTDLWIKKFPPLHTLAPGFYTTSEHSRFPDLIFIFSPKFINFTKVLTNINRANWDNISEFIPELIKRSSFFLEFPNLSPVSLPREFLDVELVLSHYCIITLIKKWRTIPRFFKNKLMAVINRSN